MDDAVSASAVTVVDLAIRLEHPTPPLLVDVRKSEAFRQSGQTVVSAERCLPDTIEAMPERLPGHRTVVVFCVHGHEVSQNACEALRQVGLTAHYVTGGFEEMVHSGLFEFRSLGETER